jgi:putative lipoprotein
VAPSLARLTAAAALAAAVVFLLVAPAARANDDPDPWFGRDKALHFSASAIIAAGSYGVARVGFDDPRPCLLIAGSVAIAAGAGKELYDLSGRGDASWRDLTWDAIGTATGLLVAWAVDRSITWWLQPPARAPASP